MRSSQYPDLSKPSNNDKYPDLSQPAMQNSNPAKSWWDSYQDFMQPAKNDASGNPMPETLLGRLPAKANIVPGKDELNEMMGAALGGPGMKVMGKVAGAIPEAVPFMFPQATTNKLMNMLGQGKTAEENITDLAKRLFFARSSAKAEALSHKEPVFKALGNNPIFHPNVASTIKNLTTPEFYTGKLKNLFESFKKNPILNNSDALLQQLGDRTRELQKLLYEGKLDRVGKDELNALMQDKNSLMKYQDSFINRQSPIFRQSFDLFKSKWKNNVSIFDEHPILAEISRKGTQSGFTPSEIKNIFSYPSQKVKAISNQIGPSGVGNILYNELQSPTKHAADFISEELGRMEQFGYQHYINPDLKETGKMLGKSHKVMDAAKTIGSAGIGGALGSLFGHPVAGAMIGASTRPGYKLTQKMIENLKWK